MNKVVVCLIVLSILASGLIGYGIGVNMPKLSTVTTKPPKLKLLASEMNIPGSTNKQFPVPEGKIWRVKSILFVGHASSEVGNRNPLFELYGLGAFVYHHISPQNLIADMTIAISWFTSFPQIAEEDIGDGVNYHGFLPDVPLASGDASYVGFQLTGHKTGDTFDVYVYGYEEDVYES